MKGTYFMTLNFALLIVLTTIATVTVQSLNNLFGKTMVKSKTDITRFTLITSVSSIFAFITIGVFSGGLQMPTLYTTGMGAIFGLILTGFQLTLYRALGSGSFAYTTLLSSCGMVISALFGVVWFGQSINVFQIIGLVLMMIMFYFNANPKKNESVSAKWLFFAIIVFFLNGSVGVMQTVFQAYVPDGKPQMSEFLIVAFLIYALASFVTVYKNEKKLSQVFRFEPRVLAMGVAVGIGTAINHRVNLYLSGVMDSIIFFPVVNGASLISCTIVSATVFKEKHNIKQYTGIVLGILAILLLSNVMSNFINILD